MLCGRVAHFVRIVTSKQWYGSLSRCQRNIETFFLFVPLLSYTHTPHLIICYYFADSYKIISSTQRAYWSICWDACMSLFDCFRAYTWKKNILGCAGLDEPYSCSCSSKNEPAICGCDNEDIKLPTLLSFQAMEYSHRPVTRSLALEETVVVNLNCR